ncbi:MAG: substrate-binding periplasmic protein [Armatimonadota bacterium]
MRQRTLALILTTILLAAASTISGCNGPGAGTTGGEGTSVYDRITKAGKIRAAYLDYPPACMKDTKTGKLTGVFVETLEKAAENLGLTVEWTEEVGWGAQIEGLQTDRYDIVGSPVWANPNRGKLTTLSKPLYYSGIGIYVRSNENRFTGDWRAIDSSSVRIATIDGETGDLIARTQFPQAKRVSSPQNTDIAQKFLDITGNKADVFFTEPYFAYKFLESNPGTVKNVAAEKPIRILGNCYMFKRGEVDFKHMLDVAFEDLLNSGYVDQLLDKYEPEKNTFYRVALPYRVVK